MSRTNVITILTAMQALLAGIASTRLVTRHMKDHDAWPEDQRAGGIFTILPGPRDGYDYEYQPGDLPRVRIFVYGERRVSGEDPGPDIDAEEDAMAAELEDLANQSASDDDLCELALDSIVGSAQTMTPYASVLATYTFGVDRA